MTTSKTSYHLCESISVKREGRCGSTSLHASWKVGGCGEWGGRDCIILQDKSAKLIICTAVPICPLFMSVLCFDVFSPIPLLSLSRTKVHALFST